MAGDWISLRDDLLDSLEVIRISIATGIDQPAIIGHLYLLWSWADRQTYDGSSAIGCGGLASVSKSSEAFIAAAAAEGFIRFTNNGSIVVGRGRRKPKSRPLSERDGTIYFVLARKSNLVKIGFTSAPIGRRIESLQTGSSEGLELIGMFAGTMDEERECHYRFSHLRSIGEWFRNVPPLSDFISELESKA